MSRICITSITLQVIKVKAKQTFSICEKNSAGAYFTKACKTTIAHFKMHFFVSFGEMHKLMGALQFCVDIKYEG